MKAINRCYAGLILILLAAGCAAQAPESGANQKSKLVLRNGTEVVLKLAQDVNSQRAKETEPVEFVVAEAVKVGEVVVAPAGSRAIGTVVHSAKPNFAGDPGELSVKMTFLKAGKTKVPLRGSMSETGNYRTLIRGTQALIAQGTQIKAFVDADTELEVSGPLPEPPLENSDETSRKIRLANGTSVRLLLTEPVSSKTAKVGDAVKLQVLDDVKVGDLVIIPARAPAIGSITDAKAAGMAWHSGQLAIRIESVQLINQQTMSLELASSIGAGPTNAVANWSAAIYTTQGLALFALPFAPLQHGNQAMLRRGAVLEAATKGEVLLDQESLQALQPKQAAAGSGPASVTFYFPGFGEGGSRDIWIGAVKLGGLKPGRKVTCKLPPGQYSFHVRKKGPGAIVDLQEGTEYYVRVGLLHEEVTPGTAATGLTIVPHDVGEIESMDTSPAEWKAMPDLMQVSQASLQETSVK